MRNSKKETVASPVITVKENATNREKDVKFTVNPVKGVEFHYTINGDQPSKDSSKYTNEVTLTAPDNDEKATVTIKVIAVKGELQSEVAEKVVTYAAKVKEVHEKQVAPRLSGVSAKDATGKENDGKTLLELPVASGENKFVYKIEGAGSEVATPKVDEDLNTWTPMPGDKLIETTNDFNIGVAEVTKEGKAVKFVNVKAKVVPCKEATKGTLVGKVDLSEVSTINSALGDCLKSNKKLIFTVDSEDITVTFNKNYSGDGAFRSTEEFLTFINGEHGLNSKATASIDKLTHSLKIETKDAGAGKKVAYNSDGSTEALKIAIIGEATETQGAAEAN